MPRFRSLSDPSSSSSPSEDCCDAGLLTCSPFGWVRLFLLDTKKAWPKFGRNRRKHLPLYTTTSTTSFNSNSKQRIVTACQVPLTERIPYIESGYRHNFSIAACVRSLWTWHNETLNVWTHLLGAVYFLFLGLLSVRFLSLPVPAHPPSLHLPPDFRPSSHGSIAEYQRSLGLLGGARHAYFHAFVEIPTLGEVQTMPPSSEGWSGEEVQNLSAGFFDVFVFTLFLLGALICHTCSAIYHLCRCHSPAMHQKLFYYDVVGICCLILGSYIAGLYYGFGACHPTPAFLYSTAITVIVFIIVFSPKLDFLSYFNHPSKRLWLLVSAVGMAVLPVIHWLLLDDTTETEVYLFLHRMVMMLGLYALGFLFYYTKFPERSWPGKFDILFHSHQIWHVFVTAAAVLFHSTLLDVYVMNKQKICGVL